MPTDFELTESKPITLDISKADADLLSAMGRELASKKGWWGATPVSDLRSVIDVRPSIMGGYEVTFREVIGVAQIGKQRFRVGPKIPWDHFAYIASRSEFCPRLSAETANVEAGFEFLDVLCRWFIDSTERLVRVGLRQDYSECVDQLEEVRGQLLALETAVEVHKGRPVAACVFDELTIDTPLNRILRAACQLMLRFRGISAELRSKARRLAYRMDGIGPLRQTDRRVKPDRLTKSYVRPVALAHLILDGCGISLSDGQSQGTSFLIRTPEIIEDGLRSIIAEGLPHIQVSKRRQMLGDSGISMNPDIVFGNRIAIADVKYKYFGRDWNRNDFNQIVAFATAFDSPRCALFGFVNEPACPNHGLVQVGRIEATRIAWPVNTGSSPEAVANAVMQRLSNWLSENTDALEKSAAGCTP